MVEQGKLDCNFPTFEPLNYLRLATAPVAAKYPLHAGL
ncbi:unnamed protein product [Onchocerca flexuosa]|uniref:Uncharacterized protein n=1 Tax=Onchocerca flexuosa TaxID=387005 RepID=A0A183HN82_9BILA|nr:unnamed protein product [Onchocerca flexuosa]